MAFSRNGAAMKTAIPIAMYQRKPVEQLKIGDVILPPERELHLWMRRHNTEMGLSESGLHLQVQGVEEGTSDKGGRWLIVTAEPLAPEWKRSHPFRFKARPQSPWAIWATGE